MRLILMRHAKSSWDDPRIDDFDRPLNARGRASATALGEWLARLEEIQKSGSSEEFLESVEIAEQMPHEGAQFALIAVVNVLSSHGQAHSGEE